MTQIDHRLILSGVQANPFGSMLQGAQTRNVMDEMRVEAKKRNFLSENGQALYQGDQNALSQYANVDIGGAMALRNQHEARQLRQEAAARARAAAGRAAGNAARRSQLAAELHESKSQLAGAQIALANGTWDEYAKSIGVPEGTDGTAFVQRGLIELQAYDEAVKFGQPSAEEAAMEAYRDIIGGEEQQAAPAPQPPTPEPMGSPSGLAGASLEHMPPVTNALAGPAGMSAPPAPPPAPERAPIPPADYGSIFGPVHASPAPGRGQAPVIPTETPSAPPAPAPQAVQQPVPQPQPQPAPQPVAAQPAQPVDPVQAMIAERARFDQALLIPNLPASAKAHAQMMIERLDGRIAEARKPKPAREMFKDANGRQRWIDDQSLVVPDLKVDGKPATPQSAIGKLNADLNSGLISQEDYTMAVSLMNKGESFSLTLPDGTRVQMGDGGEAPPDLTVDAAKNTGFLIRTQEANRVLGEQEAEGLRFLAQNADSIPIGLGNYMVSENFQKYDQARRNFVNAVLRRESGAVIADSEFENANRQYFPVPGDSPGVIAQKRQNRLDAIEGLRVGSGAGAGYVQRKSVTASDVSTEIQAILVLPQPEFVAQAQKLVVSGGLESLPDAEKAAILKRLREISSGKP